MAKYIFVTGGVVSSLGKGITAASSDACWRAGLEGQHAEVRPVPERGPRYDESVQHGEVFVTDDGAENGPGSRHYERFTHAQLSQNNNLTSGRSTSGLLPRNARRLPGQDRAVIPHVTNEIKAARGSERRVDVVIVEIGGTVGDIESQPFTEAIRQMRHESGAATRCSCT